MAGVEADTLTIELQGEEEYRMNGQYLFVCYIVLRFNFPGNIFGINQYCGE